MPATAYSSASCAGRRMAQTAAHLVERVIFCVPTRQWVVSVPIPLRYWMAASQDLTAQVHTIICTTIGQYYVNQAVTRGRARQQVQPGSVTCIQRFGSALNVNVHSHIVFLEGVYLDRTAQDLKPRFIKGEPPSDADIADVFCFAEADVVQTISRRVICKLCHLGDLEASSYDAVATGSDPLLSAAPELARTLATSVTQRIVFGERAGQPVRRIGSGFGYAGESPALTGPGCASVHGFALHANTQVPAHRRDQLERLRRYTARGAVALERLEEAANGELVYRFTKPWSDGTPGITLSPLELLEKLAALVPLPRVHLVRYGGCLAPHSRLRGAITPPSRQQGVEGDDAPTESPRWSWARLLKRVFALDLATCLPPLCGRREALRAAPSQTRQPCALPFCHQGALRILAAITQAEVMRKILRHLKRAADPPPLAPARARQATFDWVASAQPLRVDSGATCAQRRAGSPRCAVAIPFEIGPLQPSAVARPEPVPPGAPLQRSPPPS